MGKDIGQGQMETHLFCQQRGVTGVPGSAKYFGGDQHGFGAIDDFGNAARCIQAAINGVGQLFQIR
ncbi:hypothetical protein D3C72_2457690 [compost metagenome]